MYHDPMTTNAYYIAKQRRRVSKKINRRSSNAEMVLFIFEKVLENWATVKIYNVLIQQYHEVSITKKKVETIATGNCKVYPHELSAEEYVRYNQLRQQVYEFHKRTPLPSASLTIEDTKNEFK